MANEKFGSETTEASRKTAEEGMRGVEVAGMANDICEAQMSKMYKDQGRVLYLLENEIAE